MWCLCGEKIRRSHGRRKENGSSAAGASDQESVGSSGPAAESPPQAAAGMRGAAAGGQPLAIGAEGQAQQRSRHLPVDEFPRRTNVEDSQGLTVAADGQALAVEAEGQDVDRAVLLAQRGTHLTRE